MQPERGSGSNFRAPQMRTAPPIALRFALRTFATMAERNPALVEDKAWQMASEGTARLLKQAEGVQAMANWVDLGGVIVPVNFAEDPRQLQLRIG